MLSRLLFIAALGLVASAAASAHQGYYRQPALHGNTLVFVSEGDLWRVPARGGAARRLTTHAAAETQPAFSPDGSELAFIAAYGGERDVYLMPLAGGMPRRLTHGDQPVALAGFRPGGGLVYASERTDGPGFGRVLREVDLDAGSVRELPLADAREAAFSADGATLWFTRFGLAVSGDHARRYRGGAVAQLWRRDGSAEARRLPAPEGANLTQPMWWQGRLYLISDADGQDNLWVMDGDGGNAQQLTRHQHFGVREARLDAGRIVYRLGAELHLLQLDTGEDRAVPITLESDLLQQRVRYIDEPRRWITDVRVDAEGERVALTARGQALLAGPGELRRAHLAVPADARARGAVPSADGTQVFAIVDQDGGSEIWRFAADGSGAPTRLLADAGVHRWRLWPSPDGRWLAHADKRARLWLLDLQGGANHLLDETTQGDDDSYTDVAWSADGRYLAWSRPDSAQARAQLFIAAAAARQPVRLTTDRYVSHTPAFAPDGRWLYFLSERHFSPDPGSPWGDRNTGARFDRRTGVFALALQPGLRSPLRELDELVRAVPAQEAPAALPAVDFSGLSERLVELDLPAGNYNRLLAGHTHLYVLERQTGKRSGRLRSLAIKPGNGDLETFTGAVLDAELAAGGKRLMVVRADKRERVRDVLLLDAAAKAPAELDPARVHLEGWTLRVDPRAEWRQMFTDAWALHRHFSFDADMRGVDWDAVRTRFEPLLARVGDRFELDDLLGQMTAELGILHSQVRGGDYRKDADAVASAALGAVLEPAAGGMRVARIYRTDPELPSARGPLEAPGVDVRAGDLITAINGRPVRSRGEVLRALRGQADAQVLLDTRRAAAARRIVVRPVSFARDARLRYSDWQRGKAAQVAEASDGRIGYLHLYSMVGRDFASFAREFYTQYDREGLIIDVRRNRGGNIDSWVIEKLLRRAWAFWKSPVGASETNMQQSFRGHLVVLADAFTYSDGETFTAAVKALGLGPVIGQRTAGAGIWLSDRNRLRDGGLARIAESGQYDLAGRWIIEGRGVAPDIAVENLPVATARGADAQLSAALAYLRERIDAAPLSPLRAGAIAPVGEPAQPVRPLPPG